MEIKTSETFTLKTKTNDGEFCKQRFVIAGAKTMDTALLIGKWVLTSNVKLYRKYGYKNMKNYKGKSLMYLSYGIKLSSLNEVLSWANTIIE